MPKYDRGWARFENSGLVALSFGLMDRLETKSIELYQVVAELLTAFPLDSLNTLRTKCTDTYHAAVQQSPYILSM